MPLSLPIAKCRIWETNFQVFKALPSLPQPYIAVLEKQISPRYHVDCKNYVEGSAMLRVTLQGEGCLRIKERSYALPPGTAYLMMDRTPGAYYYYPSHAKKPWVFLWFGFRGPCVRLMVEELLNRYGTVFKLPLDSPVVRHMESFGSMKGAVQALSPTAGAKIVMDVLAGVGELVEQPHLERPNVELVKSAQTLLRERLEKNISVGELATLLKVSREHLSRVFKEQTGLSPLAFAQEERMRLASQALLGGRMSCKELAARLGYESASSFARAFKRHYGCSPSRRFV